MKVLLCSSALVIFGVASSAAMGTLFPPGDGKPGVSHSAPSPLIGVGLPSLVALGGYVWYRRRRRSK